jgi:pimeloyl-ACP methyl ester carboxylesterase
MQRLEARLGSGPVTYFVEGEGRPLLYLHPAGGVRWTHVMRGLARSFRLYVPVAPGFDGTPAHAGLDSMKGLGALAGQFVEKVIGAPCDVMGCSFGGCAAMWLALQRAELVDHLVLECPAGLERRDPALRADPAAFRKALFLYPEKMPEDSKPPELEGANRKMLPRYRSEDGRDPELMQRIGEIGHRTLVLHGVLDRIVTKESVQLLKSRLKRSFLIYFWDAAHGIEVDQPERMLAVVEEFLTRSEAFVVNRGTLALQPR